MLKVTFPHIGNSYIPIRSLLTELGLEPVIPPPITPKTISLGTKLAPEFACFPLKVNLGNYLEAIERGADAILMAGGVGPCRFGYYGEVQREILAEAGYGVEFLVLEAPKTHPRELWEKIKRYFPRHRPPDMARALRLAWLKAAALDKVDRLANQIRPLEKKPGTVTLLQDRFYQRLDRTETVAAVNSGLAEAVGELNTVAVKENQFPVRIVLLGEIYLVLEARVNFQIERLLGDLGVTVRRTIYFTDWVREHLLTTIFSSRQRRVLLATARPYLANFVGGHGLETVAHTVEAGVNRAHGVVQLAPFTCMPEIVAMQVLPAVSRDLNIPALSIIIDEHSAEAGVQTRLEAFVDLLRYRRKQPSGGRKLAVVSGH